MKKAFLISFYISILCFGLITYLTGTFEASFDGYDIMGWPINFYSKCGDCINVITQKPVDGTDFTFLYFLIDYTIIFVTIFIIVNLTKKLMKK